MAFQTFKENPQESTIILSIIGLLSSDGLSEIDIGVLGRSLIYLGETLQTLALFIAAYQAEEAAKSAQEAAIKEEKVLTEQQQQNQYLQEQIWALQEALASIQNKS
jgi:uncharacterized protein YlxW (UPF0749 family)